MEQLRRILNPKGTKPALLAFSMVLHAGWVLLYYALMDRLILSSPQALTGLDTTLMLGIFIGAVSVGFVLALLAKDKRGITYGFYGGLAGMVVAVILTRNSPLLAGLVGLVALLGGYNGGMLGEMYRIVMERQKHQHK